jgi:hypothetical protein
VASWVAEAMSGGSLDAIYAERNAVILAFAAMAERHGWFVGVSADPNAEGWPVLLVDTDFGQVSWHLPAGEMPEAIPPYPGEWDGHTTPEKYARLKRVVGAVWP